MFLIKLLQLLRDVLVAGSTWVCHRRYDSGRKAHGLHEEQGALPRGPLQQSQSHQSGLTSVRPVGPRDPANQSTCRSGYRIPSKMQVVPIEGVQTSACVAINRFLLYRYIASSHLRGTAHTVDVTRKGASSMCSAKTGC